jgi:hypothetical protein
MQPCSSGIIVLDTLAHPDSLVCHWEARGGGCMTHKHDRCSGAPSDRWGTPVSALRGAHWDVLCSQMFSALSVIVSVDRWNSLVA